MYSTTIPNVQLSIPNYNQFRRPCCSIRTASAVRGFFAGCSRDALLPASPMIHRRRDKPCLGVTRNHDTLILVARMVIVILQANFHLLQEPNQLREMSLQAQRLSPHAQSSRGGCDLSYSQYGSLNNELRALHYYHEFCEHLRFGCTFRFLCSVDETRKLLSLVCLRSSRP
jgi:hypothetical protein